MSDLLERADRHEKAKLDLLIAVANVVVGFFGKSAGGVSQALAELKDVSSAPPEDVLHWGLARCLWNTSWRHKKTGNVYQVVGGCRIEATGELGILYAREGIVWCRPSEEFLDGRFESI